MIGQMHKITLLGSVHIFTKRVFHYIPSVYGSGGGTGGREPGRIGGGRGTGGGRGKGGKREF